jgi:hypothetical protein
MDNSLSAASSFYAEPPLSSAPTFGGEVHIRSHVPEFSGIPALSPVVEVPRVQAAPVPASEPAPAPASAPTNVAEEPKAPSLERTLLKFGLITPAQLGDAMREESATGRPLWEIVQERGWVSREDLVRLAERSAEQGSAPEPEATLEPAPAPQVVPLPQAAPVAAAPAPAPIVPLPDLTPIAEALPTPLPDFTPVAKPPAPAIEPAPVFAEAAPAVEAAPIVPEAAPVVLEAAPIVPEAAPAVLKAAPIVPQAAPAVLEAAPIVPQAAPAVLEAAPIVPEAVPVVLEAAPIVPEAAPIVPEAARVVLEAAPAPAPVALVPALPAMSAPVAEPYQTAAEVLEPALVNTLEPAPAPVAQAVSEEEAEIESGTAFKVVLRLSNGERIDAHTCNGATVARRHAEELVRGLAAGPERWPYFSGRFVRPESIISVDIEASL